MCECARASRNVCTCGERAWISTGEWQKSWTLYSLGDCHQRRPCLPETNRMRWQHRRNLRHELSYQMRRIQCYSPTGFADVYLWFHFWNLPYSFFYNLGHLFWGTRWSSDVCTRWERNNTTNRWGLLGCAHSMIAIKHTYIIVRDAEMICLRHRNGWGSNTNQLCLTNVKRKRIKKRQWLKCTAVLVSFDK